MSVAFWFTDCSLLSSPRSPFLPRLYFPLLLLVLDNKEAIKQFSLGEQKNWLICFVFVLRNCDIKLLLNWFKEETRTRQLSLLQVLPLVLEVFEYHPCAPHSQPKQVTKKNQLFGREIAWVVMDFLLDIFTNQLSLLQNDLAFLLQFLQIFQTLLRLNQPDEILSAVMQLMAQLLHTFSAQIFREASVLDMVSKLMFELVRCCNFYSSSTRSEATALVLLLMRLNGKEVR